MSKSNMAVKYTVYASIEACDESKLNTKEDDCWHPSEERDLVEFDNLQKAEEFLNNLPGPTKINCKSISCSNNKRGVCSAAEIHLQGCTPDADNVFACNEFTEEQSKEQYPK